MQRILALTLTAAWLAAGCSSNSSQTMPSAPQAPFTLTGTWSGDMALEGTSARMTWTLTQTGTSVFGPVLVLLPSGVVLMNGTFAGSLASSVVSYTITVLAGGIPSKPACTGQLAGSATATPGAPATLAGSYTLSASTCSTPFSSGSFTLTRQ